MSDVLYQRTQRGRLTWLVVALIVVEIPVIVILVGAAERIAASVSAMGLVLIAAIAHGFSRLTVTVTPGDVRLAFTYGWPVKRVARSDIVSHSAIRNSPLVGWGIRWIPGGSVWNVWGLDAVELVLTSGRTLRIGTDDVAGLEAALRR